jgi:ribonuclease HI
VGKSSPIVLSLSLTFECTNNVVEYEALILGLERTRRMGIKLLKIFGDFDLRVN